jgi:hypothetical protein
MIRSTKSQIEEFKESLIWKDFKDELNKLAKLALLEYDLVGEARVEDSGQRTIPNSSETLIHLGDIKGRRKAVQYFLSIPDILLGIIEEKKNDSERDRTD